MGCRRRRGYHASMLAPAQLLRGPWQADPADVAALLAGAAIFFLGRRLSFRSAHRLWAVCGLIYLGAAGGLSMERRRRVERSPLAIEAQAELFGGGVESALGLSFLAAAFAAERASQR